MVFVGYAPIRETDLKSTNSRIHASAPTDRGLTPHRGPGDEALEAEARGAPGDEVLVGVEQQHPVQPIGDVESYHRAPRSRNLNRKIFDRIKRILIKSKTLGVNKLRLISKMRRAMY